MTTILIDMDDTLCDWSALFEERYALLDPSYTKSPRTVYEITTGRNLEFAQQVLNDPTFYADLEPLYGAFEALEGMRAAGLDLVICSKPTISNPTCASAKFDWLVKHFGSYYAKRLILTLDKTRVRGDYLIDDHPEVTGHDLPIWQHIVFAASYNRESTKPRLGRWSEWRKVIRDEPILNVPGSIVERTDSMSRVHEYCTCGGGINTKSRAVHAAWAKKHQDHKD